MNQFKLSDGTLRQSGQHFRVRIWQLLCYNLHLTADCPDWEFSFISFILGQFYKLGQHDFRVRCLKFITCNYVIIWLNIANTVSMRLYFSYFCNTSQRSLGWIAKIGIEIGKLTN